MRKFNKSLVLALLASTLITSCGQSPIRNPLAGRSEPKLGELPAVAANENSKATIAWSSKVLGKQERFTKLRPFVTNEVIFAADHSGKLVALQRSSGNKVWHISSGKKFTAGPTLIDNSLLMATSDAKIIAFDAHSGHQQWETTVSSEVLAPPTGGKGIILVHAIDGSISAFDQKNGELRWRVDQTTPALTLRTTSTPVISDDKVLAGFSSGKLMALNIENGLIEWERTITTPRGRSEIQRMVDITADPLVKDGEVFVVTYQGKLAALKIASGDLVWEKEISSYQNMAIDNQHLYLTDNDHNLWAIDRNTGATIWKQTALTNRYITGPAVVNNQVVVADRGGYVHFVNASNGKLLNQVKLDGKLYQNPIAVGGDVIINTYQGKVAAIHAHKAGA